MTIHEKRTGTASAPEGGLMEFGVLGPLTVLTSEGPREIGSGKQRAILAVLILNAGRVVSTDRLLDLVWGDEQPANGVQAVRFHVWKLRGHLDPERTKGEEGVIATRAPGYVLLAEPDQVDANRFASLAADAHSMVLTDPAQARRLCDEALSLWRGAALADVTYEDFARIEIVRLEELRLRTIEDRIEASLALGDHQEVIGEISGLADLHPERERLWELLMLALYRSGRQAEALDAYRRLRTRLGEELGIDPSPQIRQLEERILLQDPDLMLPGPAQATDRLRGYALREQLGRGAFGVVWRAVQPGINRDVAVKVIRSDLANRPAFVRRFESEARLLASLEHPHIVPLFDFWRDPDGAYLVMPLLRRSLAAVDSAPLPPAVALELLQEVAGALAYAHRCGVVHGDVSPGNVLLDDESNPYLADFGVASLIGDEVPATASPAYSSPEQVRGEPLTPRADVFGLGALSFRMLTGHEPVAGEPLPPVAELVPGIPSEVDAVLATATAPGPADRYPGPVEFVDALGTAFGATRQVVRSIDVRNPYKGLRAFTENDAADFFGRDDLVAELVGTLQHSRLVAVVGPSGCGKSSLVHAGLLPELRRGALPRSDAWLVTEMTPGQRPMVELEAALLSVAVSRPSELGAMLAADAPDVDALSTQLIPEDGELLVIVDQLEEVFTLTSDPSERRRFLDLLVQLVEDPRHRFRVVVTLRADFYDQPLEFARFGGLVRTGLVSMAAPSPASLAQAVTQPAAAVGVDLEPGLAAQIVLDIEDQPGGLPLMEFTLTELFGRRSDGMLTMDAYRTAGGVTGAIAHRAEDLYGGYDEAGRAAVRQVFLRLAQVQEGMADTRRRVPLPEIHALGIESGVLDEVLAAFGTHRLLTFDRDPITRVPTVEVAHEALLTRWARLGDWIDDRRDDLVLHRRLTAAADEWSASGAQPSYLLAGGRLEHYEQFARTTDLALTTSERGFLAESRRADDRASMRRSRRRTAVLAVISAGLVATAILAWAASANAQRARLVAADALVGEAQYMMSTGEFEEAAIALEESYSIASGRLPLAAMGRLVNGHELWGAAIGEAGGNAALRVAVDWNRELAGVVGDEGITVLDMTTGDVVTVIEPATVAFTALALTESGDEVLAGDENGRLTAWSMATGTQIGPPAFELGVRISDIAVTTDGVIVVSAAAENDEAGSIVTAVRRDPAGGWAGVVDFDIDAVPPPETLEAVPVDTPIDVQDLALSSDGTRLLTAGSPTLLAMWDLATGELLAYHYGDGQGAVWGAAFSENDRLVAAGYQDRTLLLHDGTTLDPVGERVGPLPSIQRSVSFRPGTGELVTSGQTGLLVWSVSDDGILGAVPSALGATDALITRQHEVSPDGRRALVAVSDRVRMFSIDAGSAPGPRSVRDSYRAVALDGTVAWLSGNAGSIHRWDMESGAVASVAADGTSVTALAADPGTGGVFFGTRNGTLGRADAGGAVPLAAHDGLVWAIEWSPSGSFVATASADDTIVLRDPVTLEAVRPAFGPPPIPGGKGLKDLAFVDETTIVTAGFDGHLRIWDTQSGTQIRDVPMGDHELNAVVPLAERRVAVGDELGIISIVDVETGDVVGTIDDSVGAIRTLAVSPDGDTLSGGGADDTVRLWTLDDLTEVGIFSHNGAVRALAYLDGGAQIIAVDNSGGALVWDASWHTWPDELCDWLARWDVERSWPRVMGDAAYEPVCD